MKTWRLKFFNGQAMGEAEVHVSDINDLALLLGGGITIGGVTFWEWELLSMERIAQPQR